MAVEVSFTPACATGADNTDDLRALLVGYSDVLGIIDGSPAVLWAGPWTWQAQLTWIGKILGLDTKAAQLLTTIHLNANLVPDVARQVG